MSQVPRKHKPPQIPHNWLERFAFTSNENTWHAGKLRINTVEIDNPAAGLTKDQQDRWQFRSSTA